MKKTFKNNIFYNATVFIHANEYTFSDKARIRFRGDANEKKENVFIDEVEFAGKNLPSSQASDAPSQTPIAETSQVPTSSSSGLPSFIPTSLPSSSPSQTPSLSPSFKPSSFPTTTPSIVRTIFPSIVRTISLSAVPTISPSIVPTISPSIVSTISPSVFPYSFPSISVSPSIQGIWTVLTFDDFKSEPGNFKFNNSDAEVKKSSHAHQGDKAARIRKGKNSGAQASFFHHSDHNVSSFTTLRIHFYFKALRFDEDEGFFLEYSSESGMNWNNISSAMESTANKT